MPQTELRLMCRNRFAAICSKISLTVAIVFGVAALLTVALPVLSAFALALEVLFKALTVVATLGLIFLFYPEFMNSIGEKDIIDTQVVLEFLRKSAPYVLAVLGVLAILSIVLFACDKRQRHGGRLACNIISLVLGVIIGVICFVRIGG